MPRIAKRWLTLAPALVGVVLLSAWASAGAGTSSVHDATKVASKPLVVPCDQKASTDPSGTLDGYRVVLGIVSVPPPVLMQVGPTKSFPPAEWTRKWPFSQKAGLDIHPTHKTVTVTVPKAWRTRVAILWGNARPPVSALQFQPCPFGNLGWNGYAGGFFLRQRRECVPLAFAVGNRSRTVRFGFDMSCPKRLVPAD